MNPVSYRTPGAKTAKLLPFVDARLRDLSERILLTDPLDRRAAQTALDILMQLATMPPAQQQTALHLLRQFGSLPSDLMGLFLEHVDDLEQVRAAAADAVTATLPVELPLVSADEPRKHRPGP